MCVSVCLSRGYLWNHTRDLNHFLCMLPIGPPPALLQNRKGSHTKTAEPIGMPFGMMSGLGPTNSVLHGGDDLHRGSGNFWGKYLPDMPYTRNNYELGWSMRRHTTGADTRLQALAESIIGREGGGAIEQHGRSLMSTTALLYVAVCCFIRCINCLCAISRSVSTA